MRSTPVHLKLFLVCFSLTCLTSCDGDGNAINPFAQSTPNTGWTSGVYEPYSEYEAFCANPRTGNDADGIPFPDVQGTATDENNWLRSWSNELYLWYDEIQDRDPANYTDTLEYFNLLKTDATTASGAPKDKFHYTYDTEEWEQLSGSGISAGYGATFTLIASSPPRQVVVAYTEPSSPASDAGLARGAEILTIDGVDVEFGDDVDTLNNGLFPSGIGQTHEFEILDLDAGTPRTITMTSAEIESDPVQHVTVMDVGGDPVGYMLFNDHLAPAEEQLVDAIEFLAAEGVVDLVLDLRYNGGGFLAMASQLAYMIAGPTATNGQVFEELQFNAKHPSINPVTGSALQPTPFISETIGFENLASGSALPSLDLSRVYVLTGSGTCSASESIMNALRGIGVDVFQFGGQTCGKPYGFYPTDNCGTTYFSIQFQGVNAVGFGDYSDGFIPTDTAPINDSYVPGCEVADDFTHSFADVDEARLAAALQYRDDGTCPSASMAPPESALVGKQPLSAAEGHTPKSLWQTNRIMRAP